MTPYVWRRYLDTQGEKRGNYDALSALGWLCLSHKTGVKAPLAMHATSSYLFTSVHRHRTLGRVLSLFATLHSNSHVHTYACNSLGGSIIIDDGLGERTDDAWRTDNASW